MVNNKKRGCESEGRAFKHVTDKYLNKHCALEHKHWGQGGQKSYGSIRVVQYNKYDDKYTQ